MIRLVDGGGVPHADLGAGFRVLRLRNGGRNPRESLLPGGASSTLSGSARVSGRLLCGQMPGSYSWSGLNNLLPQFNKHVSRPPND